MGSMTRIEAQLWVKNFNFWALVGASPKPAKYAYQLFQALRLMGKTVFPVNPAYPAIDGLQCYATLVALPIRPEVVVVGMAPARTLEQGGALQQEDRVPLWFPPPCFDDAVLAALEHRPYSFVADLCPIGLGLEAGLLKEKP